MAYQLTREEIVKAAIRKLGVVQTLTANQIADGVQALDLIIAAYKTKGMPLWAVENFTFTPTKEQYEIGVGKELNYAYPVHIYQITRDNVDVDIVSIFDLNTHASSTGIPLKAAYLPKINYGVLHLWPVPTATINAPITVTYQRPFNNTVNSSSILDFPEEWQLAVIYRLATDLAPEWGIPLQDRQALEMKAKFYLDEAESNAAEDTSLFLQPERRY